MVFVYIRIYFAAKARARRGIKKHPRKTNNEQVSELWLKWGLLMCVLVYMLYSTNETWLKRTQYANIFVCNCVCMCVPACVCGLTAIAVATVKLASTVNANFAIWMNMLRSGNTRACHMSRMRNILALKVSRHTARAFKLQFSANFLCHVRVAATNCCRSTLQHPPWHSTHHSRTALRHVRPFLLIWRAHSRWQPLCQGYSTKWHRLAFPLCAAAAAAATLWTSA